MTTEPPPGDGQADPPDDVRRTLGPAVPRMRASRASGNHRMPGAAAVITCAVSPPPPLLVQLEGLRAAFPGWEISIASFGTEQWFEASRPGYNGPGPCALVAGTAADMWCALRAAADQERPVTGPAVTSR
jgi:hypothetical protein